MTRDQLTDKQRTNVWPGFSFLDDRGWGYGVAVDHNARCGWDGGFGTTWSNVPSRQMTVVVLTQRAVDDSGPLVVCAQVLASALAAAPEPRARLSHLVRGPHRFRRRFCDQSS